MLTDNMIKRLVMLALLFFSYGDATFAATAAGNVMYAIGDARAIDTAGSPRALRRGDDIVTGERLVTGAGRLQIRFSDGGLLSLQPQTEFQVSDYNYEGKTDGSERGFFSLVRGGIRAVTGAIGRTNRRQYQVRTRFATIGIRGTSYKARVCSGDCSVPDGLYAKGGEGTIVVFNDGGELDLSLGERAYTSSATRKPAATDIEPDVGDVPAPAGADADGDGPVTDTNFVAGQAVFQGSVSGVTQMLPLRRGAIAGTGSITIDGELKSGSFLDADSLAGADLKVLTGSFNQDGGLIGVSGTDNQGRSGAAFVTNVVEPQTDGILYLGRWTNGTVTAFSESGFSESDVLDANDNAHYIVGIDDVNVPLTGTGIYSFSGLATSSTGTDGSIGQGIVSGQVTVGFGTNLVSTNFNVGHAGAINVLTNGFLKSGGVFEANGFATGAGCNPSCSAGTAGFLAGTQTTPERLGLAYEIIQQMRDIVGVGGFTLGSSVP